ncbi:MAG: hypothetical protein V3U51_00710 [Thermoplasmata archaeon]
MPRLGTMSRRRKDARIVLVSVVPWEIEKEAVPSASEPALLPIEAHFIDQEGLVSARSEMRTGTARQMVKRFISRSREVKPPRRELRKRSELVVARLAVSMNDSFLY